MLLNKDFAYAREIIQKSLTLDSGKLVNFIQKFGPLVSFSYNLVLVLWIFNKILELLIFFPGKYWLPLLTISPCKNPYSKTFLDIKFLFVYWFSKFLRHILGLKEC